MRDSHKFTLAICDANVLINYVLADEDIFLVSSFVISIL